MQPATARYLGLLVSVALVGLVVVVLGARIFGAGADPEGELIAQLKRTEKDGLTLDVPAAPGGSKLVTAKHRYDRFSVWYEPGTDVAFVACTLDLEGKLGPVSVGAVTVEKIAFRHQPEGWVPVDNLAPNLVAALSALSRRLAALQSGDQSRLQALVLDEDPERVSPAEQQRIRIELGLLAAMKGARYEAKAWYLRAEGDEVTVTEDYRLQGDLPNRPIDEVSSRRLTLRRRGSEFFFWPGLM